jgi:hypothetical protein
MNRALGFALAIWTIVGALVTVVIFFYGGLFLAMNLTPWNFPGDPPVFELLISGAVIVAVVNLPLAMIVGRFGQCSGLVLSTSRLCSRLAVIVLVASAAGILERHDARWRAVRDGIREYGDLIAATAGTEIMC